MPHFYSVIHMQQVKASNIFISLNAYQLCFYSELFRVFKHIIL